MSANAQEPNFSREVLPILSDRCYHCHGPDDSHREAELRLDQRESSVEDRGGYQVISPGKADQSEMIARILSDDEDLLMPPPSSNRKKLTKNEVDTLKRWINSGATWGKHWAFEIPLKEKIKAKSVHPVDFFIDKQLAENSLKRSARAELSTLLRRVSFDLTGLPPTPEQVKKFDENNFEASYASFVDELLASPHYGERMAMWWLDAARYADTDGYQQDQTRNNWPWRDWVVQSFNENKPFDQFTIEQFAGDLLPDATDEQILATCFHRNHMTNGEGGRDPEESRVDYVMDRVNTTGTLWLGLTVGCAQCHSHKFDPITQKDYYQLNAFFNSIDEDGKAGTAAKPYLAYQSPLAQAAVKEAEELVKLRKTKLDAVRKTADSQFPQWLAEKYEATRDGYQGWVPLTALETNSVEGTILTQDEQQIIHATGPTPNQDEYLISAKPPFPRITGIKLEVFPDEKLANGKYSRSGAGEFILTDVKLQVIKQGSSQIKDVEIVSAVADYESKGKNSKYGKIRDTLDDDPRNGWTTEGEETPKTHIAVFGLKRPLVLAEDEQLVFVMLHRSTEGDANIAKFRVSFADQVGDAVKSLSPTPLDQLAESKLEDLSQLDGQLRAKLLNQYLADHQRYQQTKSLYDAANRELSAAKKALGKMKVMVLKQREKPRTTHVLVRGVWDKKGEEVKSGVPSAILDWPVDQTQDRLQLANWIVEKKNPLTARVLVNHLWQLVFGAGIVRTPEDFGLQGQRPTHPELIDWLAVELMDNNWDIQHILRLIVTSKTYQQSSQVSTELLELDPENKLYARGARFRLPSWMLRDAALQSSGLLNPTLGGAPVKPYQPPGVWQEMFMGRFTYQASQGPAQYRRTLYAFWRRSSAPTFLFDSAKRRVCQVNVQRTNTPLHALTLLNDQSMLEAAKALAIQATKQSKLAKDQIQFVYRHILLRNPTEAEFKVLKREHSSIRNHYLKTPEDAISILSVGQPELLELKSLGEDSEKAANLATVMMIASLTYNLDEAITHE